MTPSINIFDECGLNNEGCNYYKQNPYTVVCTSHSFHCKKAFYQLYTTNNMECFRYKVCMSCE